MAATETSTLAEAGILSPGGGERPGSHLPFLDGLRGIAALYVVLYHLLVPGLPRWAALLTSWVRYGHIAVDVFIVLSGYCLMLPVAKSATGELRGGWRDYLVRRAKRILPPYYAALLLSIPIEYFHRHNHGQKIDLAALSAHFVLLHNLSPSWNEAFDIPMWSVATEWQIYFFLPLLLLPVWRKFGMAATVVSAFLLSLLPHFLLPAGHNFDWACPWFLGLFSIGMWGAVVTDCGLEARAIKAGTSSYWLIGFLASLTITIIIFLLLRRVPENLSFISDAAIGLCAMCLIVVCALASREPNAGIWARLSLRLFQSRGAEQLGKFSYSLYLTHSLIYFTIGWLLARHTHTPLMTTTMHYFILLPIMLVCAYGFYRIFELPTMRRRSGKVISYLD